MLSKILLATDFGQGSDGAVEHCLALAEKFSASVIIHHAIETLEVDEDEDETLTAFYESLRLSAEQKLHVMVDQFRTKGVTATALVTLGRRWNEIVSAADREGAELIILGSQEPAATPPGLVGTTSHKVFLTAHVPILVVRPIVRR